MNVMFKKTMLSLLVAGSIVTCAQATMTESTGAINGTVPVLTGSKAGSTPHSVSFTIDHKSGSTSGMSPTDDVTLSYVFADSENDIDSSTASIRWFTTVDGKDGSAKTYLDNDGKAIYTIKMSDAGLYLGAEITEQTSTGLPTTGQTITIMDISTNESDIPDGPIVGGNIGVMIVDKDAPTVNLIGASSTALLVDHTYQFKIWYDTNNDGVWDSGELDAAANYTYKWNFDGTSATTQTPGGYAASATDNKDLTIPATNEAAKAIFATAGNDGVQGYKLKVDYNATVKAVRQSGRRAAK